MILFAHDEVEHILSTWFDYAPLSISLGGTVHNMIKPFRFLKFWLEHVELKDVAEEHWKKDLRAISFLLFNHKIKQVKKDLLQ